MGVADDRPGHGVERCRCADLSEAGRAGFNGDNGLRDGGGSCGGRLWDGQSDCDHGLGASGTGGDRRGEASWTPVRADGPDEGGRCG